MNSAVTGPDCIMLIRHAEKPINGVAAGVTYTGLQCEESLIPLGWQRAGALCHLFGSPLLPTPTTIFASLEDGGQKGSLRPEETLIPYACLLNGISSEAGFFQYPQPVPPTPKVPLNLSNSDTPAGIQTLASQILKCTGVVLVAWQHQDIYAICTSLNQQGLPISNFNMIPTTWPGQRFDMVYCLQQKSGQTYVFAQVPQMLLPGDSKTLFPV